jgi:hypothetical protein
MPQEKRLRKKSMKIGEWLQVGLKRKWQEQLV